MSDEDVAKLDERIGHWRKIVEEGGEVWAAVRIAHDEARIAGLEAQLAEKDEFIRRLEELVCGWVDPYYRPDDEMELLNTVYNRVATIHEAEKELAKLAEQEGE